MFNLLTRMRTLTRDDRGQDLIEYALLAGLIALGSVALITAAGVSLQDIWTKVSGALGVAAAGMP